MSTLLFSVVPRANITLTSDVAIESILADIPFFCVGLVAFAFFSFLLVMKRVTLLSIYLYSTALFGFIAALLDLAQILARGADNVNKDTGMTSSIIAIINTREVGLSITVGLRFLFFWAFVAERPRGEPPPTANLSDPKAYVYYAQNSHSAQWERWGYLGVVLKWLVLAASLSIPILQIIWRIAVRHLGTVYTVESTIEILVSALFILKVFLNIFLSPVSPWWKALQFYIVPLVALLINLALGIGELVSFMFYETVLGRFLQALEIYIMIIFLLVVSFYKIPVRPNRPGTIHYTEAKKARNTVFMSTIDAGPLTFDIMPSDADERQTRLSVISRVSSWMLPRRQSTVEEIYQRKLEVMEAALGSVESETTRLASGIRASQESGRPNLHIPSSPKPVQVVRDSGLFVPASTPVPAAADSSSVLLPTDKSESQSESRRESQPDSRPSIGADLSYYGIESRMSFPIPAFLGNDASSYQSTGTDSPVYGLDGIVNRQNRARSPTSSVLPSDNREPSVSSFDQLIQQQVELDRSIAALRLFSPPESFAQASAGPSHVEANAARIISPETASSSNNRTVSTLTTSSARSEFSLSVFPDPPTDFDVPSRASFATMRTKQRTRLSRRDVPTSLDNGSVDVPSIPNSPTRLVPGRQFDSNATQYDVTSFIGHLTSPAPVRIAGASESSDFSSRPLATALANTESEAEAEPESDAQQHVLKTPIVQVRTDQIIEEESEGEEVSGSSDRNPSYPSLRPFFLGHVTAPAVSSPLSGSSRAPIGPRKPVRGRVGLPSQPRLAISSPRPLASNDGIETLGTFETPRRAPPPSSSPSDS
jgi:hypothetical protein